MQKQPTAILIMGPTASGKTALALEVADRFPVEIISVDSALVYRDMDIGTSKPDQAQRQAVPHHLIDICDPAVAYSAAEFRSDATQLMQQIVARGKMPLLVGGTMLYYRALLNGLSELPSAEPEVRARLEARLAVMGSQGLHQELQKIDPVAAEKIHPNDPQRIQRALEVFEITARPISEWWREQQTIQFPFNTIKIGTMPAERSQLHAIIERRFDEMLQQGFVDEVERLKIKGNLDLDKPSMRCVGYRQIWQYLDGDFDYAVMREKGIAATRQLAKRQLTWLRRENEVNWVMTAQPDTGVNALRIINQSIALIT